MDSKLADSFRAAFEYLLNKKGHGAQSEITKKTGIRKSYINNVLKGRSPGDEERRRLISNALGLRYEDMIFLGENILGGASPDDLNYSQSELDADFDIIKINWHKLPKDIKKKIIELVEEYSGPSFLYSHEIQQHKKHSEDRGYYIWEQVCIDSGLSAIYDRSQRIEILESYMAHKLSDISLYQKLNEYIENVILTIKHNI